MRKTAAEWLGVGVDDLAETVSHGFPEWGLDAHEYRKLHRFAVTQRDLFRQLEPMPGAGPALRRLSTLGVRIRIITHRLYIDHFHQTAVAQTVEWLDHYGIPYWDLCFMREKGEVGADLYVDDAPGNIAALQAAGKDVIVFTAVSNRHLKVDPDHRADNWQDLERLVTERFERHQQRLQQVS